MKKLLLAALAVTALPLSPALAQNAPASTSTAMTKPAGKHLEYVEATLFDPSRLLPAPPAKGSPEEARELKALHDLLANATPARLEQARWDNEHEDPAIFNAVVGRDLTKMPATWALLKIVQSETALGANYSKTFYNRMRPWGVDATLPNCDAGTAKQPTKSYPSGHSTLSYSVGWTLAQLMPDKAQPILARAQDYALSREYCGAHFPSDTEASHVLGTLGAATLFADPRLAPQIAAARAEIRAQ